MTLEFVDTPLSDVVEYLKDCCKIEIQIDNAGIAAAKKKDPQGRKVGPIRLSRSTCGG